MASHSLARALAACMIAGLAGACSHYNLPDTRSAEIGVLTCQNVPGTYSSVLISSRVELDCMFRGPDREERYAGEAGISFGVDLAWQREETVRFAVLSAVGDPARGFLAGRFVGASASGTVGVGLGVGSLVGGGANQLSLQPLGVSYGTGLGLSAGISYLVLEAR